MHNTNAAFYHHFKEKFVYQTFRAYSRHHQRVRNYLTYTDILTFSFILRVSIALWVSPILWPFNDKFSSVWVNVAGGQEDREMMWNEPVVVYFEVH
jgi:hypothetical protein